MSNQYWNDRFNFISLHGVIRQLADPCLYWIPAGVYSDEYRDEDDNMLVSFPAWLGIHSLYYVNSMVPLRSLSSIFVGEGDDNSSPVCGLMKIILALHSVILRFCLGIQVLSGSPSSRGWQYACVIPIKPEIKTRNI